MKKYLIIILFGLLSSSITSCSKDRKPTYQELLEEHEENESTKEFIYFIIGLGTVIAIYRSNNKKR